MENGDRNYMKIVEILRGSKPSLFNQEEIENEVIRRIRSREKNTAGSFDILRFLYGWVHIGWVRKSLAAASVLLVSVFICQQATILRQVNKIGNQSVIVVRSESFPGYMDNLGNKLAVFRLSRTLGSPDEIAIPDQEIEQLLKSYDKLQSQYSRLIRIIQEDPELRKYVEKKLGEEKIIKPEI